MMQIDHELQPMGNGVGIIDQEFDSSGDHPANAV